MTDIIEPVAPTASIVTSFKSSAGASHAPQSASPASASDPFGPAVVTSIPQLSGAALSAIQTTADTTRASTPSLPSYDKTGHSSTGTL